MRQVTLALTAAPLGALMLSGPAVAGVPIPMDGKIDRQQGFYTVSADSAGSAGSTSGAGSSSSGAAAPSGNGGGGGGSGAGSNARPVVLTAEQKALAAAGGIACTGVTVTTGDVPAQCRPAAPAPSGGGGGRPAPRVTVAQVREKAADQIKLTKPDLKASPCLSGGGCTGTVGVPVWLWVGDGSTLPTDSASASAGPYTVNVEAKVREVKWSLGDGQSTICQGSGTAYDKAVHGWSAPDCGFESGWSKAGTYTLTASYVWDVNWSGSVTGADSQTLSSTQEVTVREVQTTVTTGES